MSKKQVFPIVSIALIFLMGYATCAEDIGTRENPVPIGNSVDLGDGWQITVQKVIPDATDIVLKENMFNKLPKPGDQFFIARVQLKYTGTNSAQFGGDIRLRAVGPSSVGYSTFQNSPGVIPDPLPNSDVFTGGVIEGNVGWEIKSTDADALVMYDNPLSFGGNNDRVYMALYTDPIGTLAKTSLAGSPNNECISLMNEAGHFFNQGKYDEAVKTFDKAIEINQSYEEAWVYKGFALSYLGKYNESINSFDKAIEINQSDEEAWFGKGMVLGSLGKYNESINSFDKAIEINQSDEGPWIEKGRVLGSLGKYDEALKAHDKSLEINPNNADGWFYKGILLGMQSKYDEAIKAFDEAIRLKPNNADGWFYKGLLLEALGRTTEANVAKAKAKELGYTDSAAPAPANTSLPEFPPSHNQP